MRRMIVKLLQGAGQLCSREQGFTPPSPSEAKLPIENVSGTRELQLIPQPRTDAPSFYDDRFVVSPPRRSSDAAFHQEQVHDVVHQRRGDGHPIISFDPGAEEFSS